MKLQAPATLQQLVEVCEQLAATSSRRAKQRMVAEYLVSLEDSDLYRACTFLSGQALPLSEEAAIGVGGATLGQVVHELASSDDLFSHRRRDIDLGEVYRRFGDLGDAAEFLFESRAKPGGATLAEFDQAVRRLAASSSARAKQRQLFALLEPASALEAKYIIKILTGDLRIGAKEGLLESAIAQAFQHQLRAVQRASLYLGDMGEVAIRARHGRLADVPFRLFHPIRFMLASPIGELDEIGAGPWMVEDKYDGIRAQVHKKADKVRIFTRTLDEVHQRFPELVERLLQLRGAFLLDGEIVASDGEQFFSFGMLQRRLGRRKVGLAVLEQFPCSYVAFDLLYQDGRAFFDEPLTERRRRLEAISPTPAFLLSTLGRVHDPSEIEPLFTAARERGTEGIVVKDPQSSYTPGRRGKAWRKLKRPSDTLDCVVVAAEYGHGKRHGLLSDYTFAVRDGDRLLTIAKAYSGLTDLEIQELTKLFRKLTVREEGSVHWVQPVVVMEVAFDAVNPSNRHTSGYALRFPRIVRIRRDKTVDQVDTLEHVKEIHRKRQRAAAR